LSRQLKHHTQLLQVKEQSDKNNTKIDLRKEGWELGGWNCPMAYFSRLHKIKLHTEVLDIIYNF